MLTEHEVGRIWQRMVESEVRSLYFADLASNYRRQKQIITGTSFVLSSGAVATLAVASSSKWVPLAFSLIIAVMTAYSIAIGLDKRVSALSKLHNEWNRLQWDYERLWNHWSDDGAEETLRELIQRAREASEIGTEMPYDKRRINKWEQFVFSRFPQATL
jgi:hypothetical protein